MVHLHTRSCYSLLESSFRIDDIIQAALENHHTYVTLTDHHSMYATMEFIKKARANHLHPIIGLEVEVYQDTQIFSFVLLAKDDFGLQELYALSTFILSNHTLESISDLASRTTHCICLTSGQEDTLLEYCQKGEMEKVKEIFKDCNKAWDDFYVSMAMNDSVTFRTISSQLKSIAILLDIPTVALSRIFYKDKQGQEQLKVLRAIAENKAYDDSTLMYRLDRYYRSDSEMAKYYDKEDLEATITIAQKCNVQFAFQKSNLPEFKNNLDIDNKDYLVKLTKAGLKKRLNNALEKRYVDRLEYELSIIIKMGFTNYFLIVWDFIRYARKENIYVGPGRGSAAGSLVAYCLGITHVDPIKNGLLFERFLNPERISMPDIDVDFPDEKREQVIQYVHNLYGSKHVSHIITFNTLKAKQVIRDAGRAYRIPSRIIDQLSSAIEKDVSLQESMESNSNFISIVERERLQNFISMCMQLEGLPRHTSIHAGGIILSNQEITKVCPLVDTGQELYATQFTMEHLEELGLIKMDFLGIKNLTIIEMVIKSIEKTTGKHIHPLSIPLNDKKTYSLLSRADTLGVFQLESSGIQQLLLQMKPQRFQDICAVLALYRPGPMQNIPLYIQGQQNPTSVTYIHPLLEPILKETYGIIVYQEQIMQIAQTIGSFTLAQADTLRKAMGKKNQEIMNGFRNQFIEGAMANKVSKSTAEKIFDLMERFAQYGFNKSHSYAYGLIVYQMAYLKANYPLHFYQAILNSVILSKEKTSQYVYECKRRNILILTPDINHSKSTYTIEKNGLRMPLTVMKGIGAAVQKNVLAEREKGPFIDFLEFIKRAYIAKIGTESIRTFIYGGALDSFGLNRATMIEQLDPLVNFVSFNWKMSANGQSSYQELASPPILTKMKENKLEKARREKEVFGFYLTEHPVQTLHKKYPHTLPLSLCATREGYISVIGQISKVKTIKTKKNESMCFMAIEDESAATLEVTVFPKLYEMVKNDLKKDALLLIDGKKDARSLIANKIQWLKAE